MDIFGQMTEMNLLTKYLMIINIVGFFMFLLNTILYAMTDGLQVDKVLTVTCLAGGSVGILLSMLIFDRKAVKGNMMSRVFLGSVLITQIVIYLFVTGHHSDEIRFRFWDFFDNHRGILIYLCAINIIAFIAFAVDKYKAVHEKWRIKIVTLLGLAFIGGSIGAILAMYLFRHKVSKDYFAVGVPLIMIMQVFVIFYLMNTNWI